jgi:hypothetical protein
MLFSFKVGVAWIWREAEKVEGLAVWAVQR